MLRTIHTDHTMLKKKRLENGITTASLISHVIFLTCNILLLSHSAYSAEVVNQPLVGSSYRMAPIRFSVDGGGYISYLLLRSTAGNSANIIQSLNLSTYTGIQARSFIWQPWFAQVKGGLVLGFNKGLSNSSQSSSNKSSGLSVGGDASLKLIPTSRFPFEASIAKNRSKQGSGLTSNSAITKSTFLSLTQRFDKRNGSMRGSLGFTHDLSDDGKFAPNTNDVFSLEFQHVPAALQQVRVIALVKRSLLPRSDSRSLINNFTLNYIAKPTLFFSINSILNLNNVKSQQANNIDNNRSKQISIASNWFSPKNAALNINGSVRAYSLSGASNSRRAATASNGANFQLSTSYFISNQVRARGSVSINDSNSVGQSISTNISLTSTKAFSDIATKFGWQYRKYAAASIFNLNQVVSNNTSNSLGLSLSAGHSLTKSNKLWLGLLTSNANQTTSRSFSTDALAQDSLPLNSNGSITWSALGRESRSQTTARITASDLRAFGNGNKIGASQLYSLQVSRTQSLPRYQSLSGNISMQKSNVASSPTAKSSSTQSARAMVSYNHSRLLQVRNLTFSSMLRVDRNNTIDTLSANTVSWDNNFKYIVGSLELDSRISLEKIGNTQTSLVQFLARRSF
jgi:hypothetical protein